MTLSEPPLAIDPYRWLRNGLGIASLLLLEASWTAPWMATYFAACDRLTVGWWLMFLFLSGGLAVVLSRLQRARVREPVRRQAYGMAALGLWLGLTLAATSSLVCPAVPPTAGTRELALTLLQVPSQAALLLAVYWTWREAVPLAGTDGLNPSSATSRLQRALLGLAAYLLVFQPGLSPQLVGSISLTVASGLIGVGLGRASYLGQVRAAARLPFRGRWLLTLLAVCGGVLAVGLLLGAGLVHPGVLRAAGEALAWIAGMLVAILAAIAGLVIGLGSLLVGWFQVEAPPGGATIQSVASAAAATPIPAAPSATILFLAAVGQQLELIFSLLILGLLAYFAVRGVGGMGLAAASGAGSGFEPASAEAEAEQGPEAGRLRQAWNGLRRRAAQALASGLVSGASLRGLYLQLLAMAGARGRPRRPAETPLELVGPLSAVFPGGEGEIQALTKAFQEARYGGVVDSPARLQAARQALDFLKTRAHNADRGHA